jgi:hypothetical protein
VVGATSPAVGITEVVLLSLAPTAAFLLAVNAGRIGRRVARTFRRRADVVAAPLGPPIEQIAADLRRIGGQIEALPPRVPRARRDAAILAYDDVLASACRALDIDDAVSALPVGPARDAARVRVEQELALAGLVINGPWAARG